MMRMALKPWITFFFLFIYNRSVNIKYPSKPGGFFSNPTTVVLGLEIMYLEKSEFSLHVQFKIPSRAQESVSLNSF